MAKLTEEQFGHMLERFAGGLGLNVHGGATKGRKQRREFDLGNIDQRLLGLMRGHKRETEFTDTPFLEPEEDFGPEKPKDDVLDENEKVIDENEDIIPAGDAPAPTGQGTGIGVLGNMIGPIAASVASGGAVPPISPIALVKMVIDAIRGQGIDADDGTISSEEGMMVSEFGSTPISQDQDSPVIGPVDINQQDPYQDAYMNADPSGEGGGSPGNAGVSSASQGSATEGGGQEGDSPSGNIGNDAGDSGDGK